MPDRHARRLPWLVLLLAACAGPSPLQRERAALSPPLAEPRPHQVPSPFGAREDEYYWLRDDTRADPAVLRHLERENAYARAWFEPRRALQERLYREIAGRLKPDDYTLPWRKGEWWYYTRHAPGSEHSLVARRRGTLDAPEEMLVDAPARSAGLAYYKLGEYAVSVDGSRLAWTEDRVGRRQYRLQFRALDGSEAFDEAIDNVEPGIAIANDNRTVLYVEKDPRTLLGVRVRKHLMGTDPAIDPVVYEERDRRYFLSVHKSRSERFLNIRLESTLATEQLLADADDPALGFHVLLPRTPGVEYEVEDAGERFLVRHNIGARNFRLSLADAGTISDPARWHDLVRARDDVLVEEFLRFGGRVAVVERGHATRRIRVLGLDGTGDGVIAADAPSYSMWLGDNPDPESGTLRYRVTALATPTITYDYVFADGTRRMLKQDAVQGGYDERRYQAELVHARAPDGARVPISLVRRRDLPRDGRAPLYLYGYGAYGESADPTFVAARLSLLERGFVVALAHVRGGSELGRDWYEQGRALNKRNSFTDFIAATEFLVREGYAARERVVAVGGSAGGLLVGAVANMRPDLYRGIVARVPFVDVITTGLDETIPLTSNEYDEWGDPRDRAAYEYLLGYSPYDNVKAQAYPAMLVTTGLWDSQVQYFEPTKWVARLRARKTDANPVLLTVDMNAGHGGRPGRYQAFQDTALEYSFILEVLGMAGPAPVPAQRRR